VSRYKLKGEYRNDQPKRKEPITYQMQMNRQDIRAIVYDFLDLLEKGQGDEQANIRALELALDQLALAYHAANDVFENGHPDPIAQDYNQLRQLATTRFPKFGLYNVASKLTEQITEAEMQVGDAMDDIADIARDLSEVVWCWEHNSEKDALWHFRFGYENHWGEHLRNLQKYLYTLRREL
jgi:hypothetical protein